MTEDKTKEGHPIIEGECYQMRNGEKMFAACFVGFGSARKIRGLVQGNVEITTWNCSGFSTLADSSDIMRPWPKEEVSHWRPIETAPKDGSTILATNGFVATSYFWSGAWVDAQGRKYDNDIYEPLTHWMRLPKPPKKDDIFSSLPPELPLTDMKYCECCDRLAMQDWDFCSEHLQEYTESNLGHVDFIMATNSKQPLTEWMKHNGSTVSPISNYVEVRYKDGKLESDSSECISWMYVDQYRVIETASPSKVWFTQKDLDEKLHWSEKEGDVKDDTHIRDADNYLNPAMIKINAAKEAWQNFKIRSKEEEARRAAIVFDEFITPSKQAMETLKMRAEEKAAKKESDSINAEKHDNFAKLINNIMDSVYGRPTLEEYSNQVNFTSGGDETDKILELLSEYLEKYMEPKK